MSGIKEEANNALEAIHRMCSEEQQNVLESEFRLLRQFIDNKKKMNQKTIETTQDDYRYLNGLSQETIDLVISLVNNGYPNLYHSMMAIISNRLDKGYCEKEVVREQYRSHFNDRYNIDVKLKLLDELFDLCWDRMQIKKRKKK